MKKKSLCLTMPLAALLFWATGCKEETTIEAEKLKCEYLSDVTLENHNPNGVDYECDCEVDVSNGTFTIKPGVEIIFTSAGALYFRDLGVIKAIGTSSEPIIMHGNGTSWKGVSVNSENDNNELNNVQISNAGDYQFATSIAGFGHDYKASVVANGKLKVLNSSVSESRGYGVAFLRDSECTGFSNNQVDNSASHPLFMYAGYLNNTSLATCSFSGNAKNTIAIYGHTSNADVEHAVNFIQAPIPYQAITNLKFLEPTKMAAGTTIIMSNDKGLFVDGDEYLEINGTSNNPVTIKGETQVAGFWKGILVNTNNPNNVFNHLNITDGGSSELGFGNDMTNIAMGTLVSDAQLTLNNCTSERYSGSCQVWVNDVNDFMNNSTSITSVCIP